MLALAWYALESMIVLYDFLLSPVLACLMYSCLSRLSQVNIYCVLIFSSRIIQFPCSTCSYTFLSGRTS